MHKCASSLQTSDAALIWKRKREHKSYLEKKKKCYAWTLQVESVRAFAYILHILLLSTYSSSKICEPRPWRKYLIIESPLHHHQTIATKLTQNLRRLLKPQVAIQRCNQHSSLHQQPLQEYLSSTTLKDQFRA